MEEETTLLFNAVARRSTRTMLQSLEIVMSGKRQDSDHKNSNKRVTLLFSNNEYLDAVQGAGYHDFTSQLSRNVI